MSTAISGNVFALYFSLEFETMSTEKLLTMILCLIDICKAQINFFRGATIFANAYTSAQIE
jgi:hypothetical protein